MFVYPSESLRGVACTSHWTHMPLPRGRDWYVVDFYDLIYATTIALFKSFLSVEGKGSDPSAWLDRHIILASSLDHTIGYVSPMYVKCGWIWYYVLCAMHGIPLLQHCEKPSTTVFKRSIF